MITLFQPRRASNQSGKVLAVLIAGFSRYTVWPFYLWVRGLWLFLNEPHVLFWCISTLYFAFWVWLVIFLAKEYRQYPGMSMDALFAGSLLAVASALRDADVMSDLAKKGFGAAAWVVLLSACALVLRNCASISREYERAGEPSSSSTMDKSAPAA
jgi:hypothetical protein